MKKIVLTTAIVLAMGLTAFAQQSEGALRRSGLLSSRDETTPCIPSNYSSTNDENANPDQAPIDSGIAVLVGLGGAYLVGKKRREE